MCFNKPVTKELSYSLVHENHVMSKVFETCHNVLRA
jgi:hypothetical protein